MRLLLLPAYYYPEKAASLYLSDNRNEAFAQAGMDMIVYVPTPCRGISAEVRRAFCKKEHKVETLYGGKMILYRFPLYAEGTNPVMRAFRYVLCWIKQLNRGLFAYNIDVVFLASPPPLFKVLWGGC